MIKAMNSSSDTTISNTNSGLDFLVSGLGSFIPNKAMTHVSSSKGVKQVLGGFLLATTCCLRRKADVTGGSHFNFCSILKQLCQVKKLLNGQDKSHTEPEVLILIGFLVLLYQSLIKTNFQVL